MPDKECDLIMKGGITSGIVYPKAIEALSREYRFRSIGGSSAGAIGAVLTAAAEYRRQTFKDAAGFDALKETHKSFLKNPENTETKCEGAKCDHANGGDSSGLLSMLQPSAGLGPLFRITKRVLNAKPEDRTGFLYARAIFFEFWMNTVIALCVAGIFLYFIFDYVEASGKNDAGGAFLALISGFLVFVAVIFCLSVIALKYLLTEKLPENDFGMCTGVTAGGKPEDGFVDWMHQQIEMLARGKELNDGDAPLLIRDLKDEAVEIDLACMTTDLSTRRPYRLPLEKEEHYFSEAEFRKILPKAVVNYLVETAKERDGGPHYKKNRYDCKGLYRLPFSDAFPVILVARMSLSFPGLISAVPLYRVDKTLVAEKKIGEKIEKIPERLRLRRCLFSDGGISSNFPIHIFDSFLPSRPTFGIALGSFDEGRTLEQIDLPTDGVAELGVWEVNTLQSFLGSIVNTAKDWQDSLQSQLPGYAERIVTIRLDEGLGGLNLRMNDCQINTLAGYGETATDELLKEFKFDVHRFRRAATFLPEIEKQLAAMAERYDADAPAGKSYREVLRSDVDIDYAGETEWREQVLEPFAANLSAVGQEMRQRGHQKKGLSVQESEYVSKLVSDLRLVASARRGARSE